MVSGALQCFEGIRTVIVVVRFVPAIGKCVSTNFKLNSAWLSVQIMAGVPVGFPVPQMQEGLHEREALDCFILVYIDYCTVMGWFRKKAGCKCDDDSPDGRAQWKKESLCMSTLRATLPSKMKRLINPNNKTLGLSEEGKSNPVKVLQALVKRFSGSVNVQAERTKIGRMLQSEGESISAWECRVVERAKYCEYGEFEDQPCRHRFIAGLVDETLQGKLNTNGHRNKEGNIVEFRTVFEIAKYRLLILEDL